MNQSNIKVNVMKNFKKRLFEMMVLLVSILVFFFIFRYWDPIKDFIAGLF
jgi:hypothetical protein